MKTIEQLREEIQQLDTSIIDLLAKRQSVSKQIGLLKLEEGKDIVDLNQEKKLFEWYETLSSINNLDTSFVNDLFKLIIDQSRKVQKTF